MRCPKCDYLRMKQWTELNGDEKFLVERLPLSATFTERERETHLFCPRCWSETAAETLENC